MAAQTEVMSRYHQRVRLVRDVVIANSQLDDDAASALAVHVLQALDTIPEKMR